jgi:cob(I)alamin adenosyltransferase
MVRLDRITTRSGDDGTTGLADGRRLPKDHALIAALGAVDEANSVLALVLQEDLPAGIAAGLALVQNDLFDAGADLATPPGGPYEERLRRISPAQVARLEAAIAAGNAGLPPLTRFVLPGGTRAAAWLHLARTVVRRAERELVAAMRALPERSFNPELLHYLNRLSDLCFVWSRCCNLGGPALGGPALGGPALGGGTGAGGPGEVLWRPGLGA